MIGMTRDEFAVLAFDISETLIQRALAEEDDGTTSGIRTDVQRHAPLSERDEELLKVGVRVGVASAMAILRYQEGGGGA